MFALQDLPPTLPPKQNKTKQNKQTNPISKTQDFTAFKLGSRKCMKGESRNFLKPSFFPPISNYWHISLCYWMQQFDLCHSQVSANAHH